MTLERTVAVDPLQIEKTLAALWKEHSAQAPPGGVAAARARLANLISYCRTADQVRTATDEVAELNAVRPARSLIVSADETGEVREAEAALKCMTVHQKPICYEEVTLHLSSQAVQLLPSVVEPLTIPDLPVYIWFPGDPPLDDPQVDRLLTLTDRVVTDSHTFTDSFERFRQLHRWMTKFRGEVVFTEMTWARLGIWREAIGKLFDPPDDRALLAKVREVVITSVRGAATPSDRAMLMTGWLASKLGWRPETVDLGDPCRVNYTSTSGPVRVVWKEGEAVARGHMLSMAIKTDDATFHVERIKNDPAGAIRSSVTRGGKNEHGPAYRPLHYSLHELLCNALEIRAPYTDWEDALAAVAALKEVA